jgi:formiminotetrahydrofolate cyclodeaminase
MSSINWSEMSVREFQAALASSSPTPGGGTAAAIALGQAAALTCMVCDLTIDKDKWKDGWAAAEASQLAALPLFNHSLELATEDSNSFDAVMASFKLPKNDDDEISARRNAIRKATLEASRVPLRTAELAFTLLETLPDLASKGNGNATSDVGVAALLASAACKGALMNVKINLQSLPSDMGVEEREGYELLFGKVREVSRQCMVAIHERFAE